MSLSDALPVLRVRAVMTAQDHLRKPRQRMVRADGLILEDIERCCRYPAVGERIEQGSLLDQRPSGDVDDHRPALDLAQRLFVEPKIGRASCRARVCQSE